MSYTIGIDLGTTNTKACALSDSGEILCEISRPAKMTDVPSGGEMDPRQLAADVPALLEEVISACRERSAEPLLAIGLTGMAEAGCLADRGGEPVTPILLWYDRRGAAEAEELRERYEERLTAVSGIRMSNVATIYKLSFLKKERPFTEELRWFGVPEWAAFALSGHHFTDRTLAVRTGAYSLKSGAWSPEVLGITGLDAGLFPEIIETSDQRFTLTPEMAARLAVPEQVRVIIAGHDDMAAAYGAGLGPGCWVDSTGTAEGLVAPAVPCPPPDQTVKQRMSIAPAYHPDAWALIAGVGTSGSLLAELRKQTGLPFDRIDRLAEERASFPENAVSSELTPQRLAKVSFLPGRSGAQKVSAVYERILTNFRAAGERLLRFAEAPERLVITGGHALLPELCRRKAEILGGIPAEPRPKPEAAAFGAAKLCFANLGIIPRDPAG